MGIYLYLKILLVYDSVYALDAIILRSVFIRSVTVSTACPLSC